MDENSLLLLLNQPDLLEDYLVKYFSSPIDLFRIYDNDPRFKEFIDRKGIFRKLELYQMPNDRWRILATELAGEMWGNTYNQKRFIDKNGDDVVTIQAGYEKKDIIVDFDKPNYEKKFVTFFDLKDKRNEVNPNRKLYILKGTQLIRALYKCFSDGLQQKRYSANGTTFISSCIICKSETQTMCSCCNNPCCSKMCLNKIH
jgi:hypothetical protein